MPSSEVEIDVVRGPRITISLVVPLALAVLVLLLLLLLLLLLTLLLLTTVTLLLLLLLLLLLPGGLLPLLWIPLLVLLLTLLLVVVVLFGDVECPSSLSGGVVEPVLHEVLLLPELVPRMGSQPVTEEFGEQDRLISTRAALHSSIGSSSLIL